MPNPIEEMKANSKKTSPIQNKMPGWVSRSHITTIGTDTPSTPPRITLFIGNFLRGFSHCPKITAIKTSHIMQIIIHAKVAIIFSQF